jgi:DNA repair protein RadC
MNEPALRLDPLPSLEEAPYPSTLGDEDLVADLLAPLGAPDPDRPAAVLRACGGLAGLPATEPLGLVREGVDPEEATLLLAASELGRRLALHEVPRFRPLDDPAAVATYLALRYCRRDQEVLGALYLDRRHRLLRDEEIFRGTLSRAAVEPRPILREAVSRRAAALVLFHTHPSGDPSPSLEDLVFTRRMAQAAECLGLRLLDHLVIGGVGRWVSLKEKGAF